MTGMNDILSPPFLFGGELFIPLPFQKLRLCKEFLRTVQASLLCELILCTADSGHNEGSDSATPALSVWSLYLNFQLSFNLRLTNSLFLSSAHKLYSCISLTFRQCDGVASRNGAWLPGTVLIQLQRSYQHSHLAPTSALQHWLGAHTHW